MHNGCTTLAQSAHASPGTRLQGHLEPTNHVGGPERAARHLLREARLPHPPRDACWEPEAGLSLAAGGVGARVAVHEPLRFLVTSAFVPKTFI
jgi:hypothetical protein